MRADLRSPKLLDIASDSRILAVSIVNAFAVLFLALMLQWLVYHHWLDQSGPLRLVGSLIATLLTFAYSYRIQCAARERKLELLQTFETIGWANDRIRNALQAIACITYFKVPESMQPVQEAVDVIEGVLHKVLATTPGYRSTEQEVVARRAAGKG